MIAPKFKVVEKPTWANPEEVVKCLRRFEEFSSQTRVNSVVIIAEQASGAMYVASSRSDDKFKLASALMMLAMEMMGFDRRGSNG